MQQKELFINSVRQIRIDGQTVIPTVVLYKEKECHIGHEAIENCDHLAELREDFKVEIGGAAPIKLAQQPSQGRSTLGIAKDFIDALVSRALSAIERQGFERPSRILVAEPLSLSQERLVSEDWLKNYRGSIRRILHGKFAQIDFMPEPFAVFQYYRYGVKHPLVAQKTKHVALVVDFGGGTFDASVIETTASGDISGGGRNSRPLAAKSIPVGGFYINRLIAEMLLFQALEKGVDKAGVRRALDAFIDLKNADDETLVKHRADHVNFVRNYRRLLRLVEQAKITICSGISNWRLNSDLSSSPACRVEVPQRPLSEVSPWVSLRLEAGEIRRIFEDRIWKQNLLPTIRETIKRGDVELEGKRISIVLLSGGTSNIKWLKPLIQRDLEPELRQAEILELNENFQEIVSKGLAVDCARRYYTEGEGDFRAVTYNRLCLALNPNENGVELQRLVPESDVLGGIETARGVLLPSATSLKGLVDQALRWKVRLSKAPSQSLDYFFMRSSFDPEEMAARHNLDSRVRTPRGAAFSSSIEVELTVREDGTAEPVFIYGTGAKGKNTTVRGTPFYMDMTYATQDAGVETYLGFDFGTSTSSLCYVDGNDIRVYAERASDRTWLGLSALTEVLPYPAAYPLARFLSETSVEQMEHWGREALEGMLTLATYISYAEHCAAGGASGNVFKTLRQRSAGPLWAMFKRCAAATGNKWQLAQGLLELARGDAAAEIDKAVSSVALAKHGKRAEGLDYARILERIGNIIAGGLAGKAFGYFEDGRRKPFSMNLFQGVFRNARGPSAPFIDIYEYVGAENFPSEFVFLIDIERGEGLPLFPLITRGLDGQRQYYGESDFFLFDIVRRNETEIALRAVQEREEVVLQSKGNFPELFQSLSAYLVEDRSCALIKNVTLKSRLVER
jgi:hypothetical protein